MYLRDIDQESLRSDNLDFRSIVRKKAKQWHLYQYVKNIITVTSFKDACSKDHVTQQLSNQATFFFYTTNLACQG